MGRHPPQFSGGIFLIHKIYCHFSAVSIGLLSRDNMMTTFSIISCDQKTKFMSYFCFKLYGVEDWGVGLVAHLMIFHLYLDFFIDHLYISNPDLREI